MWKWMLLCIALVSSPAFAQSRPATPAEISAIRQAMDAKLKDAESARFKNVVVSTTGSGSHDLCGLFNSKNSFGGYGNYESFFGSILEGTKNGKVVIVDTTVTWVGDSGYNMASDSCRKAGLM